MVDTLKIEIERVANSRLPKVDFKDIVFGRVFTDHMFIADYKKGEWKDLRIVPYGYMPISPASPAIHYGQAIFEGLKAYRGESKETLVFRPRDNWKRMNISAERLALAKVPEEIFMEGMATLIKLDRAWIPDAPASSLYIRPFLFSADEYIGIRPSEDFTFMIITSPAGAYYAAPVRVKIETHYTRAVEGGTGFAKAAGNYAAGIYPSKLAQDQGYHQLIWTDGKKHEYIEESGTMNVMFVLEDTLVTPALSDSILAGITRDSVLKLARHWGMKVEERKIAVKELIEGLEKGRVTEAFGAGTAATIARIETIGYEGRDYPLPPADKKGFAVKVYHELDGIKRGTRPDPFRWVAKM
jgi:branched-chain amino acid aminotransferase